MQVGPLGDPSFLADGLAYPLELSGRLPVQIYDVIESVRDLAGDPDLRDRHFHGEIALTYGGEDCQQLIDVERVGSGDRSSTSGATLRLTTVAGRLFSRHEDSRGAS